jgi:hypothetical protein
MKCPAPDIPVFTSGIRRDGLLNNSTASIQVVWIFLQI